MSHRLRWILLGAVLMSGAMPLMAQIPEKFTNLEVLSKDIDRRELIGVMRGYAGALGVRCIHCHVGDDPNDLDSVDFASDAREPKRVARAMMRMVGQINGSLLPKTGREAPTEVACRTCHHGLAIPRPLEDVVAAEIEAAGVEAGVAKYRQLREEYHGRDAYDFGEQTLNGLAERIAREKQDVEGGIALVRLNLEFQPNSHMSHFMLGTLLAANGDREAAVASIEHALKLDPGNAWYKRNLAHLRPEPE